MNPRLGTIAQNLQVDDWLFSRSLEGLDAEDFDVRVADRANSMRWIVGHLTGARFMMAQLAGLDETFPHAKHYGRNAPHGDTAGLPETAVVAADWERISPVLQAQLIILDDAALDRDSGQQFPAGDNSVLGALSFLCLHESFHLGQLALIRVALGHPPVVR